MERSLTKRRWERGWSDLVRLGLLMRQIALDWTLSRRQRVDFGAGVGGEDEKNPRAMVRKPSF